MALLRRSSKTPKRIELDKEGSWIEVTEEITRRQFNEMVDFMPTEVEEITPAQGTKIQAKLFETFVTAWSLEGVEPTVEEYLDLPQDASAAIDTALMAHFSGIQVGEPEQKKPRR